MRFSIDGYLENLYLNNYRELTFNAKNLEEWEKWREELKNRFLDKLGKLPEKDVELEPKKIEEVDCGDYIRQRVTYNTDYELSVPAYVLIPKTTLNSEKKRFPTIVACHGHGYGSREVVGLKKDGTSNKNSPTYQNNFGLELVKKGYLVIVPELLGFGDRRLIEDYNKPLEENSCYRISTYLLMLGRTMAGMRVWETIRTIDYLITREDVDSERIGCMGISGGGLVGAFTSALDDRIKCSVISGYTNTFKSSILSTRHCIDNYIPGILNIAEMYDLIGLIAPRPLFIEAGNRDHIFPIDGVYEAYSNIKKIYEILGFQDRLELFVFEGGHELNGNEAYQWLLKWL